jgi:sugar phosphate isomerase/epimerase
MDRFVAALKRHGYQGTVNIEREIEDQGQRMADIEHGARLLRELSK